MNLDPDRQFVRLPIGFVEQLGNATSLGDLLQATEEWLDALIRVDRASFTLTSDRPDERDVLMLHAIGGHTVIPDRSTFPIDGSIVGQAFRERRVLNVANVADFDFEDTKRLTAAGLQSALVVPMVSGGRVFGTANVARYEEGLFTDDEVGNIRAVGSLIASYIWAHRQRETEHQAARIDALTGLLNRRAILEALSEQMHDDEIDPIVLFLDLDGFKATNDAHGHAAGDALLIEVSDRLKATSRDRDLVGRLGGDEFLIVCAPGTEHDGVEIFAKRLVDACSKPVTVGATRLTPRMSIGIATPGVGSNSTEDLLAEADHAMYEAKRSKDSIIVTDDRIRARADLMAAVDRDLERAMEEDEIGFYLQPIMSLNDPGIVGAESLLRWEHPEFGFVPPPLVLERVEATGQIEHFTRWSLNRVAADWARLQREVPLFENAKVAMNLNPSQLGLRRYVEWHMTALHRHGLRPCDVAIEVVESGQIEVNAQSETTLRKLSEQGVSIALDDFGTGYNALAYFTRFPIDAVKFDRSLITGMVHNEDVRIIVDGLVTICRQLGIISLAEGIETQEEMDTALSLGMDHAQGYFLGKPMPELFFREIGEFLLLADPHSAA